MLRGHAEYPHVFGEITLGERCHHAARARTGDFQANGFSNSDHLSDPSILSEGPFAFESLHHHIGSETPRLDDQANGWQSPEGDACHGPNAMK
jgi:hypothetical protein